MTLGDRGTKSERTSSEMTSKSACCGGGDGEVAGDVVADVEVIDVTDDKPGESGCVVVVVVSDHVGGHGHVADPACSSTSMKSQPDMISL